MSSPYPVFYSPGSANRPTCCPHLAGQHMGPGQGPDRCFDSQGQATDAGGYYWGTGRINVDQVWTKSSAGWWVAWGKHLPQDLLRIDTHPRILTWRWIEGAQPGHRWRIPCILACDENTGNFTPALDRVYGPKGWEEPGDLVDLAAGLLRIAAGERLASDDIEANDIAFLALAENIISLGHHANLALLATRSGWLTDRLVNRIIRCAMGRAQLDILVEDIGA